MNRAIDDLREFPCVENTPDDRIYEEPQGEIERAIAPYWRELFGLERIGRNDNFFELGGDSLIGMKLTEAFAVHLDLQLPVVAIFQNPTIRELAQLIAPISPP